MYIVMQKQISVPSFQRHSCRRSGKCVIPGGIKTHECKEFSSLPFCGMHFLCSDIARLVQLVFISVAIVLMKNKIQVVYFWKCLQCIFFGILFQVLDSISFLSFVANRGPPYRTCDLFDQVSSYLALHVSLDILENLFAIWHLWFLSET